MELVMRRVNEDGLYRTARVWEGKKIVGFLIAGERRGDIETVSANELDFVETWHSAHGVRSLSLLCRRAGMSELPV